MNDKKNNFADSEYTNLLHSTLQDKLYELETLYRNIPGGVIHCGINTPFEISYASAGFFELTGYNQEDLKSMVDNKFLSLILPEDQAAVHTSLSHSNLELSVHTKLEYRIVTKAGAILSILEYSQIMENSLGERTCCCVLIDITSEKENAIALKQSEERYKILMEQSDNIFFDWDFNTNTMELSGLYKKLTGFDPIDKDLGIESVQERVHPDDVYTYQRWMEQTYKKAFAYSAEFRFATTTGEYIWVKAHSSAIFNEAGEPIRAIGNFTNISNQKNTINYLKMQSQMDSLTKLSNKETTESRICSFIAKNPDANGAFLIVDIDNFKGVNDNLGHQFGDMVLKDIAQKMENFFSATDILGRIGGDEFAIFMCNPQTEGEVCHKAEGLLTTIRNLYIGENSKYMISLSIGISFYPMHGSCFEALYEFSDNALYESKRRGKDCYTVFQDKLNAHRDLEHFKARTSFESSDRFLASYYEGDITYSIFEMLYETNDITTSINKILEIIGKRFNVSRVYIFEQSDDAKYFSNTYEWCPPGISPEIDTLQNLPSEALSDFFSLYNQEGLLTLSSISAIDDFSLALLERQGVKALLHCGIYSENKMKGFIGFDDCLYTRQWQKDEVAALGYISKILSIFILKHQVSHDLWNSYQNYTEMLDNLNGYVYVIDPLNYEILYLNNAMSALGITIGEKCHCMAFGSDEPCTNCPVHKLNKGTDFAIEEIYSVKVDAWVSSAASKLKWTDGRSAALVCCTDISKYKQDTTS